MGAHNHSHSAFLSSVTHLGAPTPVHSQTLLRADPGTRCRLHPPTPAHLHSLRSCSPTPSGRVGSRTQVFSRAHTGIFSHVGNTWPCPHTHTGRCLTRPSEREHTHARGHCHTHSRRYLIHVTKHDSTDTRGHITPTYLPRSTHTHRCFAFTYRNTDPWAFYLHSHFMTLEDEEVHTSLYFTHSHSHMWAFFLNIVLHLNKWI